MIEGSCHCGLVRIEVDGEVPEFLVDCNCSLCRRLGGWWAYYTPDQVRIVSGEGQTVAYVQGDRTLETHHCATCGCVTHWKGITNKLNRMGVNARLWEPAVLKDVRVRRLDGADTWDYLD